MARSRAAISGVLLYQGRLDTTQARKLNLPSNKGALVMEVQPGSPAAQVGLKPNDVIVKIADHDIADTAALRLLTAGLDAGAQVPMTFYRDGKAQTATVTIAELPPDTGIALFAGPRRPRASRRQRGWPDRHRDRQVVTGSPAFKVGMRPGMRILAVGDPPEPVNTLAEFEAALRKLDPAAACRSRSRYADGRVGSVRLGWRRTAKDRTVITVPRRRTPSLPRLVMARRRASRCDRA